METLNYKENTLSTSITKLAAIFLVFGAKLRRVLPLEWDDIFKSKEEFLYYLEHPGQIKPRARVTFNFEPGTIPAQQIYEGIQDEEADEKFYQFVATMGLDKESNDELLMRHSKAIARACQETLDKREFLIKLIKSVPETAKWDLIEGNGGQAINVKIGKRSSPELRAEMLSKL